MNKNGAVFQLLCTLFPALSSAKLKKGVFIGPQIQKLTKDKDFEQLLTLKELRAWEAFKSVCRGFLDNTQVPDYQECIEKLSVIWVYDMRCQTSLKIHFLHSYLNFFPLNLAAVSDKRGERLHQYITKIESNYQGKWNPNMIENFAGCYCCDIPEAAFIRLSKNLLLTVCCIICMYCMYYPSNLVPSMCSSYTVFSAICLYNTGCSRWSRRFSMITFSRNDIHLCVAAEGEHFEQLL